MNSEFFTWATLATYAGAVFATAMMTQFLKGVSFIDRVPTRFVSYIIALVVLIGASAIDGTLTLANAGLSTINAVIVALAANGGYDAVMIDRDKSGEDSE